MSLSDLDSSFVNANRRIVQGNHQRRSDAKQSRFPKPVQDKLRSMLLVHERPSVTALKAELVDYCSKHQLPCPSRSSIYNFIKNTPGHSYSVSTLPDDLRAAMYNVDLKQPVPGHQLVFYAFHYGTLAAVSQASGLPWLDLYQASLLPAWRPRSRGLLEAALRARGIST